MLSNTRKNLKANNIHSLIIATLVNRLQKEGLSLNLQNRLHSQQSAQKYFMKTSFRLPVLIMVAAIVLLAPSCKKTVTVTPTISSTPLYALLIGDTSLSVFNAAVQKAGDSALFHGIDSITVLAPTNAALLAVGVTSAAINTMPAKSLDSLVRYHYIASAANLNDSTYTAYKSLLGPAVYGLDSTDSTSSFFNGRAAALQKLPGSNALVYKLSVALQIPATSAGVLLSADTSLSYFREALNHTGISLAPSAGWNTVLAPDNNSFIAAGFATPADIDNADLTNMTNIVLYHILPGQYFSNTFTHLSTVTSSDTAKTIKLSTAGGQVQFTGNNNATAATITVSDRIAGTNIIIQKINGVLMP